MGYCGWGGVEPAWVWGRMTPQDKHLYFLNENLKPSVFCKLPSASFKSDHIYFEKWGFQSKSDYAYLLKIWLSIFSKWHLVWNEYFTNIIILNYQPCLYHLSHTSYLSLALKHEECKYLQWYFYFSFEMLPFRFNDQLDKATQQALLVHPLFTNIQLLIWCASVLQFIQLANFGNLAKYIGRVFDCNF